MGALSNMELIDKLEERFNANQKRHPNTKWEDILDVISSSKKLLNTLTYMEATEGCPDVIEFDDGLHFVDTSDESPKGRRNCCYDLEALVGRKKFPPEYDAMSIAKEYDASLLSVEEYERLQSFGPIDTKTSSWLLTPSNIRSRGGALFGDNRYDHVFIYHNGADSYYGARGFRLKIKI